MKDYPEDDIESHDIPRTAFEIARRAIVLHCVISVAHQVSKIDITKWLKSENLYDELSPWEQKFVEAEENSSRDIINATWRVEGQVALLWSIQKIDQMDALTAQCNTTPLVDAMPGLFSSTSDFIETAVLRHKEQIED